MNYIYVFFLGCLVGGAELTSRHSDHRLTAMFTGPSLAYLFLNGLLSLSALCLLDRLHPAWAGFGDDGHKPDDLRLVLIAGFGAAAFFRSSLFKLKTPDGDVAVGPALIFDTFLGIIDESVDRTIARKRLLEVSQIMLGVDFDKAAKNLPTFCFAALHRLTPDAQQQFAFQLKQLIDTPGLSPKVKAVSLGLSIMNLTGKPVLEKAIESLGNDIK